MDMNTHHPVHPRVVGPDRRAIVLLRSYLTVTYIDTSLSARRPSHERLAIGALDEWYASWSLRHCRRTLGRRGAGAGALYVIRNVIWGGGIHDAGSDLKNKRKGPATPVQVATLRVVRCGWGWSQVLSFRGSRKDATRTVGEGRVATGLASPRVDYADCSCGTSAQRRKEGQGE